MEYLLVFLAFVYFGAFLIAIMTLIDNESFYCPKIYPKGHVFEYDPTGEYTYRHQNPRFKEYT